MTLPLLTQPRCAEDEASWCGTIYDWTGNQWLARYSDLLIAKPLNILFILLIAFGVRWLAHRTITRLTQTTAGTPKLLQPMRERRADALTAELMSERRLQRARTIGSVLKSMASFIIFGLAIVNALQVLNIEIAPGLASAGEIGRAHV